jgi:predicted PurR-regulated permease PerM
MSQRKPLIFLAVMLAALVPLLLQIVWPFLTSFILAAMIAIVMNPVNASVFRRVRRPSLAAAITTFNTVVILGLLLALAGVTLTKELTAAYESLDKRSLEEGGWPTYVIHTTDRLVDVLATAIPMNKQAIRTELIDRMKDASAYLLSHLGGAVGGVATALFTAFMVTVFLYFLLRYGHEWIVELSNLTPLDPRTTGSILRAVRNSVVANVYGVFAVAAAQGTLLVLGFWFVGVRSPVLWGTLGGLASIVPIVGAPLVWVPVVIAFLLMGSYGKALLLALWCALAVGSVDNLLRPYLVSAQEKQHPVLIALAVLGGTYAFGALGILFGPLLVSLATALVEEARRLANSGTDASEAGESIESANS